MYNKTYSYTSSLLCGWNAVSERATMCVCVAFELHTNRHQSSFQPILKCSQILASIKVKHNFFGQQLFHDTHTKFCSSNVTFIPKI